MPSEPATGIEDVLQIRSISGVEWNCDGTKVGVLRSHDGDSAFGAFDVGSVNETDASLGAGQFEPDGVTDSGSVSEFAWRPDHPEEAAIVSDGDVELFDVSDGTTREVSAAQGEHASLAWHPAGDRLAYRRDATVWVQDLEGGNVRALGSSEDGLAVADIFAFGTELAWNPGGRYLATVVEADHESLGVAVYDASTGEVVWRSVPSPGEELIRTSPVWVGDEQLVYAEDTFDGDQRVYRSVVLGTDGDGVALASERSDGILLPHKPVGSEHGRLAVVSQRTGYRHVYAIDVETRRSRLEGESYPGLDGPGVTQVTDGDFEARAHASDVPAWSEDGQRLAYVANKRDVGERQLYVATLDENGAVVETAGFEAVDGNASDPTWAGDDRIACLRAGRKSPADVHVSSLDAGSIRRVTAAHPDPNFPEGLPEPEHVSFHSADGTEVFGYLYAPPGASPGDDRPAVIQCHGGPISQMRRGFSPGSWVTHGLDQALVGAGYVVLELNFRSGIGRGDAYEQAIQGSVGVPEVADCEAAAEYLRNHEVVGERVGVWGISYGGFMANIMATKSDAVDATVNIAGIWNWRTWESWAIEQGRRHWGTGEETWFHMRFGGPPDSEDSEVQARYDRASPSEFVEGMETPILALHGVDDENVPVTETFELSGDCVEAGAPFEMVCYPDEEHGFERNSSWTDAFRRIRGFFEEQLRSD
ncbi:MAG: prolyl oligopeptidase family serine peptidase [Haloferacaceae archaeon]